MREIHEPREESKEPPGLFAVLFLSQAGFACVGIGIVVLIVKLTWWAVEN